MAGAHSDRCIGSCVGIAGIFCDDRFVSERRQFYECNDAVGRPDCQNSVCRSGAGTDRDSQPDDSLWSTSGFVFCSRIGYGFCQYGHIQRIFSYFGYSSVGCSLLYDGLLYGIF